MEADIVTRHREAVNGYVDGIDLRTYEFRGPDAIHDAEFKMALRPFRRSYKLSVGTDPLEMLPETYQIQKLYRIAISILLREDIAPQNKYIYMNVLEEWFRRLISQRRLTRDEERSFGERLAKFDQAIFIRLSEGPPYPGWIREFFNRHH